MSEGAMYESSLEMPAQMVRDCPGLSIDVGGSVAKVIYRSKAEWDRLQKDKDAETGTLQLISCVRTQLFKAVERVKQDGYISKNQDGSQPEIFTCGIGCSQFGPRINKEFNVKLTNVIEMDCFIRALNFLTKRQSYPQLMHQPNTNIITAVAEEVKGQLSKEQKPTADVIALVADRQTELMKSERPLVEELGDDMFPALMAMLGSGFAVMTMEKDGGFNIGGIMFMGGRTLLGLSSLVLGATSYAEIIDLAEKGNQYAVNLSNHAFEKEFKGNEKELNTPEITEMELGHAVGKSIADFKREDLAAAIVSNSVLGTATSIYTDAADAKVKNVFVTGGYASRSYVRDLFTRFWYRKAHELHTEQPDRPIIQLHFLKQGAYLGALGALINTVDNFLKKDGTVAEAGGNAKAEASAAVMGTDKAKDQEGPKEQ